MPKIALCVLFEQNLLCAKRRERTLTRWVDTQLSKGLGHTSCAFCNGGSIYTSRTRITSPLHFFIIFIFIFIFIYISMMQHKSPSLIIWFFTCLTFFPVNPFTCFNSTCLITFAFFFTPWTLSALQPFYFVTCFIHLN